MNQVNAKHHGLMTDYQGFRVMQDTELNTEMHRVPKLKAGRKYLRPDEANRLIDAAGKRGRYGSRDKLLLMMIYRHGLRASEACSLKWSDIDLSSNRGVTVHIRRLKGSNDSVHTLDRDEIIALRKLHATSDSMFVFVSERGEPMHRNSITRIVSEASVEAKLGFDVHPHMLRHSAGYMLANEGVDTRLIQDFLGHKNIANTVRYTQLSAKRLASVRVR